MTRVITFFFSPVDLSFRLNQYEKSSNRSKLFFYEKKSISKNVPRIRFLDISHKIFPHRFVFFFPFIHNKWKIIRYDRLASIIAIIKNQGIRLSNERAIFVYMSKIEILGVRNLPETERFCTFRPFCTKVVHLQIDSVNSSTSETEV